MNSFMYKIRNIIVAIELVLIGITTYFCRFTLTQLQVSAIALTVLAIILCIIGYYKKKYFIYYLSAILNTFATALIMNIYYVAKEITVDKNSIIIIIAAAVVIYLFLSYIFTKFQKSSITKALVFLIMITIITACIVGWITMENKFLYSYGFFISFFVTILAIPYIKKKKYYEFMKSFVLLHFFIFFVVAVVVAIVASEGEFVGDLAEGAFAGGVDKKEKKRARNKI